MASTLAYRYTPEETLSAVTILLQFLLGKHTDNPYVVLLIAQLVKLAEELRASIAFHDQDSLAERSDAVDLEFNAAFLKFRSMAETFSEMEEYGEMARNCAIIRNAIHHHGRDLHRKPKDVQITLFNSVRKEIPQEVITGANAAPLFEPAVALHTELEQIEHMRSDVRKDNDSVPAPSDVAKKIKPLITDLHSHLEKFAELGDSNYADTISAVNAKLKPIVTRVKARLTKKENTILNGAE